MVDSVCNTAGNSAPSSKRESMSRQASSIPDHESPDAMSREITADMERVADEFARDAPRRRPPVSQKLLLSPAQITAVLRWMTVDATSAKGCGCRYHDSFTLRQLPPSTIGAFVDRVVAYTACEPSCFAVALVLIDRARRTVVDHSHSGDCSTAGAIGSQPSGSWHCPMTATAIQVTPFSVHRLFAAALVLAIKSTQDVYHPMSFYGSVFGVAPSELWRMEVALMTLLDHRLFVTRAQAEAIADCVTVA